MPITNGHGNPNWSRDETILALDVLYRFGKPLDRTHDAIIELSQFLQVAPIHPPEVRQASFRNPDGVALKLQNLFSALEPGRGLTSSKTDRAVVADFPKTKAREVAEVAGALRASLKSLTEMVPPQDDEEEFVEGTRLTRMHTLRERNGRIRHKLLSRFRDKPLICEICDFTPPALPRDEQESFFEAHHQVALALAEKERTTKLADMALLCACCHRFIHKLIANRRRWVGTSEARAVLRGQ